MAKPNARHDAVPGTFVSLLDESERIGLNRLGIERRFPKGTVLMFEHEPGERVMILLAGRVKISRADENGHEAMLSIRDPGDVLGELAFVDGEPRVATVTALEAVDALVIPAETFRTYLETAPRVAVALLEVVTRRLREMTYKRSQLAASDTMGRLAARIIELAERYGETADAGTAVALPISQEELAAWVGASRAGVAQALQTMRELQWIDTHRRRLVILNPKALRARAA